MDLPQNSGRHRPYASSQTTVLGYDEYKHKTSGRKYLLGFCSLKIGSEAF